MQNQSTKKIEKIPVRLPDGSFSMVKVGASIGSTIATDKKEEKKVQDIVAEPMKKPIIPSITKIKNEVKKIDEGLSKSLPKSIHADGEINWQASVDKVIKLIKIKLFDEEAKNRLKSIIMSRLADVRDFLATKEVLTKPKSAGGLGLGEIDMAQVINVIDTEYKLIHTYHKNIVVGDIVKSDVIEDPFDSKAEINALVASELPYTDTNKYMDTIAAVLNKDKGSTAVLEQAVKPKDIKHDFKKITDEPVFMADTPVVPFTPDKPITISSIPNSNKNNNVKNNIFKATEPLISDTASIKQNIIKPTSFTKPNLSMKDIVADKRLVGPIDELKSMRLVDFRRLGNSTTERLQKIKSHIEELEDESFRKKVQAVQAWRSNPIYKMYVSIGSQGLMGTQTVADVIKEKQEKGEEILTQEEFEQLTDFNKKLKY